MLERSLDEVAAHDARRAADRGLQEQHRRQGQLVRHARELPGRPRRCRSRTWSRGLTPFFVTRQIFCGRGQARRRGAWDERAPGSLPAHAARGLLRGRGRAGDHPEAADHQHARRAARRPREVPPPARDRRRREPVRGGDVPEGRHHGARPEDDRGRATSRTSRWRPGAGAARGVPGPHVPAPVRLADGRTLRRCSCSGSTWSARRSTSRGGHDGGERRGRWSGGRRSSTGARGRPDAALRELDWVAKYRLLDGYRERDGLDWRDPKLRLIDLQYHDVRRRKGLYYRLVATGQGRADRLRRGGRAGGRWSRPRTRGPTSAGAASRRYPDAIAAASWDSIIFDTGGGGPPARADARAAPRDEGARRGLLEQAADAAALVEMLGLAASLGRTEPNRSPHGRARAARDVRPAVMELSGVRTESTAEVLAVPRSRSRRRPRSARRRRGRRGRPGRPPPPRARSSRRRWTRSWTRSTPCSRRTPRSS